MGARDGSGAGKPPAGGGSGGRAASKKPPVAAQSNIRSTKKKFTGRSSREEVDWQLQKKEVRARPLSEMELVAARRLFFELDRDGSGSIDAEELGIMLRSLGQNPTDAEIRELIESVDGGGPNGADGQIQLREFLVLYSQGLDNKGKAGSGDVNDCFLSLGGNPREPASKVSVADMKEILMNEFQLDVDVNDIFPQAKTGEISRTDIEQLLLAEAEPKKAAL